MKKQKSKMKQKNQSQQKPNSSGEAIKMGAKDVKLSLTEEHQVVIPSADKTKQKKKKTIQEDIEENYRRLIKNMNKLFEKEFGKMCPDFEPGCIQCRANLIYNNFKKELYDAFVKC